MLGSATSLAPSAGDYFDFLDLGKGRLGLVIGDIAGEGIAAALLMANLQAFATVGRIGRIGLALPSRM
jgi:serine phosphatase RsbU (regulator of sigma subunit)